MCQSPPEPTLNSAPVRTEDALCGIVRRMAVRDPRSLDAFFHAFSPVLLGVAVQMLGSRSDAEEVLQDTLVRVWEKAPAFDPLRSRAGTWALMILRGLCLDRLRSRRRRLNPLPLEADWDAAAGNGTFDPALVADVRAAWEGLAPADQVLLGRAVFSPDTGHGMEWHPVAGHLPWDRYGGRPHPLDRPHGGPHRQRIRARAVARSPQTHFGSVTHAAPRH